MDNPQIFNEYFKKYADLFCYRRVQIEAEKLYEDEMEINDDFDIDAEVSDNAAQESDFNIY